MSHDQSRNGGLAYRERTLTRIAGVHPFRLTESVIEDGCREIEIDGELDLAVADRLEQALARCRGDRVLISLESCQFIDSTGIAVILNARHDNESGIVLHSPGDQVLRVLEVTGLATSGFVFANRDEALSAV